MMLKPALNAKKFFHFLLCGFGGILGVCMLCGMGSNFPIEYTQNILAQRSLKTLSEKWVTITRWPYWFHHLDHIAAFHSEIEPLHPLTFYIRPPKKNKVSFELTFLVTHYEPSQMLELEFLNDSSGRLNTLFSKLTWHMTLTPASESSTWVRSHVHAVTKSFKARAYARMASKILLNQVFYPNLIAFAEEKYPYQIQEAVPVPY